MRSDYSLARLLPFLALLISSLPFLTLGFPKGHDWIFELVRVAEFKTALTHGQFPPYWGENLYGGYGSPIFLFYAPLFSFISAICSFLTNSITSGSIGTLLVFSLVGLLAMKLSLQAALGRETFENEAAARVSSYFLILNPYLICDKLLRNANAEYIALCISPLALSGLLIIDRKPRFGALLLAISLAATITAHNLTALITTALISTGAVVLYLSRKRIILSVIIAGSVLLGIGLSAFFWVPALYYAPFVRIDQMTGGEFDFHNQYKPLLSFFGYDQFYAAGLLIPLTLLCAVWIFRVARKRKELPYMKLYFFAFGSSLIFLFLQTRASVFIWEKIPYMPLFQFPWRMMGPLALVSSIVAGLSFAYLCEGRSRKVIILAELAILILCSINAFPHLKAARPLPESVSDQLSYMFTEDTIRREMLPATVLDEYLPRSAYPGLLLLRPAWLGPVMKGTSTPQIKVLKDSGKEIILETNADTPARLQFARWFFPGWRCLLNGRSHEPGADESGLVEVSIPAGFNKVTLQLMAPVMRREGLWISFASLILWIGIMVLSLVNRYRTTHRLP